MNLVDNLKLTANEFSHAVHDLDKTSNSDENVNNRIQSLATQIMQCTSNSSESPLSLCRIIIDKATLISDITSGLDKKSQIDLNKRLRDLINVSEDVIMDSLMKQKDNSTFCFDFFSLNNNVQNALLENPQIKERLFIIVWSADPSIDITSVEWATLFIKLASDSDSKVFVPANKICTSIINEYLSRQDVNGLRMVLNSGYHPFETFNGIDFFSAIEAESNLALALENELIKAKKAFTPETLEAYRNLVRNLDNPNNTRRSIKMDVIDRDFSILIEHNIAGAAEVKAEFDASDETRLQRDNLAKAHAILNGSDSAEEKVQAALSQDVFALLKEMAWIKGDNKLLSECQKLIHVHSKEHAVNKIIANIALDKTYFPEKVNYKGGVPNWVAPYFANALEKTSSKLKDFKPTFVEVDASVQILNQICLELHQSTRWGSNHNPESLQEASIEKNRLMQSNDLISTINSLPKGMSILIPITTVNHATLMRVEKTGEATCRVLYYNTGDGIGLYHPKGQKINTYQTFLEFVEVPLQNLQDPSIWSTLINRELPNISLVYNLLDQLCSGGIKQPPSPYPEFFEVYQASGSCAYQCILSMIRERLISSISNPDEGLALYKIVKNTFHEGLEEQTRPLRNATINSVFLSKLHIMGLEIEIAKALSDPLQREKLIDEVCLELRVNGLEFLEEKIKSYAGRPPLALFSAFRQVLSELEKINPPLVGNGLVRKILEATRERDLLNRQSYLEVLDSYLQNPTPKNIKECVESLGWHFEGGKLQTAAAEWIITRLAKVPAPDDKEPTTIVIEAMVEAFNKLPQTTRKQLLPLLVYMYLQAKNDAMAAYIQSACSVE